MWIAPKVASPAFVLPRCWEALLKCRWAPQSRGLAFPLGGLLKWGSARGERGSCFWHERGAVPAGLKHF